MTGRYIAQVNLQSKTGLAKDRFCNTFHFLGGGTDVGADCLGIAIRIADFYNTTTAPSSMSIAMLLTDSIETSVAINIYDFDQAKPRVPYTFHFDLAGLNSFNQKRLPEEVALCLSFFTIRNTPTTRNRVYIGPFNAAVLGLDTDSVTSRPGPAVLNVLCAAGVRLMATQSGAAVDASDWVKDGLFLAGLAGLPGAPSLPSFLQEVDFPPSNPSSWVVHSPKENSWAFVTGGWCDNEWDGQDRRRVKSSARTTFSLAGGVSG